MAATQDTGTAVREDETKKRKHFPPAVLDDLDATIKKLKVNEKERDPLKPRKAHLPGLFRRSWSRRTFGSISETSGTPIQRPGACGEQDPESTSTGNSHLNAVKKSSAPDLPCGALMEDDTTVDELAAYFENGVHIPRRMSLMAEMMYL
ncbi:hypothetical protein MRX96_059422 [Rhipicephalus microplus]|uniref:Oxidative stress-responsive serine-rich protein 1 n=1 Tax=Rhipicephalus microplus TaxID=6941 RepID=A0A9J6EFR7_RHIMP|nr:hypothetical protein HPB51_004837 [Rhipicephalus microplus]